MEVGERFNVHESGQSDGQPLVFAHGFGCDQHMWRFVAPDFEAEYRVILFDLAGTGESNPSAYDAHRHSTLDGYADDVLEICRALDLRNVVFVGHSVSSMIGVLAAVKEPDRFAKLVLVGPSPRYIDEGSYVGGFSDADIEELLDSLANNYLGWSSAMAPVIMANPDRPELAAELDESFCRTDPDVAARFARATFLADNRADLERVRTPTLVIQCNRDAIAPIAVGEYVRDSIRESTYVLLEATGHCPHLSAPEATTRAIADFLDLDRVSS